MVKSVSVRIISKRKLSIWKLNHRYSKSNVLDVEMIFGRTLKAKELIVLTARIN